MAGVRGRRAARGRGADPRRDRHAELLHRAPWLVADRIFHYAGVVGRENVIAGTDCGFATFANFTHVTRRSLGPSCRALVDGAALASEQLGGAAAASATATASAETRPSTNSYDQLGDPHVGHPSMTAPPFRC